MSVVPSERTSIGPRTAAIWGNRKSYSRPPPFLAPPTPVILSAVEGPALACSAILKFL
jgi:hypothetical protein